MTAPADRRSWFHLAAAIVIGQLCAATAAAAPEGGATVAPEPAATVSFDLVLAAERRRTETIAAAAETAVAIFAGAAGGGSGVLISPDGYALTNFHVVQPAGPAMTCGLADGKLYDGVIVGLDPTGDVALS